MNESKFAQQMVGELPSLVARGVIDAGSAEALRRHYGALVRPSRAVNVGLVITAILGGLLVGAGIILLLAHNWDELSKPMRAVVSVLPLLASIGLSGYAILRRMESTAWREGCGVFWWLSIGASIALVSQTYHLYNDMAGFFFWWIVLTLPVIYLLNSGAAFAGCLACVVGYSFVVNAGSWSDTYSYSPKPLALFALMLPFYAWHVWKRRESLTVVWLSWALAIAVWCLITPMFTRGEEVFGPMYIWMAYGLLGTVSYLAGCRWFGALHVLRNPFRALGSLGVVVAAMAFTFGDIYRYESWSWFWGERGLLSFAATWFVIVTMIAWMALGFDLLRRKMEFNIVAALLPQLVAIGLCFWTGGNSASLLLMNMHVLALGVFVLLLGVRRDSLFSMNKGMLLIIALIACRFFDSDLGLVTRGVVFIAVGCGFLAVNLLVMNRRRKQKESKGEVL